MTTESNDRIQSAMPTGSISDLPGQTAWKKGFWSLWVTQFQGAFSDNAFKFVVMFLVMGTMPQEEKDQLAPLIGAVFALPFILFSMLGGTLADRSSV